MDEDTNTAGFQFDLNHAVIAPCSHIFCRGCLAKYSPDQSSFLLDNDVDEATSRPAGQQQQQQRSSGPSSSSSVCFNCPICTKDVHLDQLKPVSDAYSCASSVADVNDLAALTSAPKLIQVSAMRGISPTVPTSAKASNTRGNNKRGGEAANAKKISSTKIDALLDCLIRLRNRTTTNDAPDRCMEKAIVFSQWTSMLDLLQEPLENHDFGFVRLDGTMTQAQREVSIQNFKTNPKVSVFLISMKAGGLGLNLTEANHVFILDPWWSPSIEAQAIDRVHRIGQTRPVTVTRFVIKNSIEERILQLQERKKLLAKSVLGNQSELKGISLQDLRILFS
jgi:SNF2 family DNA or RNA helicase